MTKNMGSIDRIVRAIVGIILLVLAFTGGWSTLWTVIAAVVGLVLLATSALGYCPPYSILGIKTNKADDA
ncbi:DUF2892 domain-containing protein [Tropicimonas sp. IMCC6043]|uniref:YgaP family membrane protein n=1 Tax=Tropicimonas sp. IMCC6043 TaxID=2510645 RepID=UPI00101D4451|nr:DUF2892 domain-containing protein [Tropicimonas sp. IMCC6043]RYH09581.1 DUF2892 domain-containing protein [Tropicimonas sp. IMCC6043]